MIERIVAVRPATGVMQTVDAVYRILLCHPERGEGSVRVGCQLRFTRRASLIIL